MTKLIILRGNSGSGKTTTAIKLQHAFPAGQALRVSQDEVRLGMLNVKDRPANPAIDLLATICKYGKGKCDYVILEGILGLAKYQPMLRDLITYFDEQVYAYYFDLTFAETLRRHRQRAKAQEFGAEVMQKWWLEHDYLNIPQEQLLPAELSQSEVVARIIREARG